MISMGIDVSKCKSTICFLKPYGELLHRSFDIEHTEVGLKQLSGMIGILNEEVKVVMEATGTYHLPILNYLKSCGFYVSVINPFVKKKYANLALRKGKTDSIDAIKIASYGLDNWFRLNDSVDINPLYEELKILNRQYLSSLELRINAKLTLTNLLDRTMPGIKTLLRTRSDVPGKDKLCAFASKYWHFDNIKKCRNSASQKAAKWASKEG